MPTKLKLLNPLQNQGFKEQTYFSLIVATVNRSQELVKFLESLAALKVKDFEVIVVDQNASPVIHLLEPYKAQFPLYHYKYPVCNASLARNFGAQKARGNWLAFPDDDCCYTESTLEELRKEINNQQAEVYTGVVLDFNGKAFLKDKGYRTKINSSNVFNKSSEPCFFIKKEVFQSVQGFDQHFGPGSVHFAAEGLDLAYRCLKSGARMIFNPSIAILHPRKYDFDAATVRRGYTYAFGNGSAMAKHHPPTAYLNLAFMLLRFLPSVYLKPRPLKKSYFMAIIKGLYEAIIYKESKKHLLNNPVELIKKNYHARRTG